MIPPRLKELCRSGNPAFWDELRAESARAPFEDLIALSTLRKKGVERGVPRPSARRPLRLALLGGCSLYPLSELLAHFLDLEGYSCELFVGDFDNFVSEIADTSGALYAFKPEVVVLLPGPQRCRYTGRLTDPPAKARTAAAEFASELLGLCAAVHDKGGAEVILCNFPLPARHDPGPFRARTPASDWNFRKLVNLELGHGAQPFVRICDAEFLAARHGGLLAEDARGWFESKQPCSPAMLAILGAELAAGVRALRAPPRKVLVLDLDNTLWGGVVADDGVEGIELGDTSPRGEAFKAFQKYVLQLKDRGVLLAVCSKNDDARAREPFERHPEMVLRLDDIVSFKANWDPKPDNLHRIASELRLGVDSLVFADDNPAEVEMVRQFAPQVATILLGPDPSDYVGQLKDCRHFEPAALTLEDTLRTNQYKADAAREVLQASSVDMDAYLASLGMEAVMSEFTREDAPRLSQLINKSNQFNLTTRRRTEAEVADLVGRADCVAYSMRLSDRFGDHGLISVVIGRIGDGALEVDTWIMSCRVLKREVERTMLNQLVALARGRGCRRIRGVYLATPKNGMVRDFYSQFGFSAVKVGPEIGEYLLDVGTYMPVETRIHIMRSPYEPR